jgi:hypothetical protein
MVNEVKRLNNGRWAQCRKVQENRGKCTWKSSWQMWMIVQFGGGSPKREDVRVMLGGLAFKPTTPDQVCCEKSGGQTEERNHGNQATNASRNK